MSWFEYQDARPIVMGHVFRKLVFKCTFRLDAAIIRDRLLPHQVAVGVSGGAEALVHTTRDWIGRSRGDATSVLLQKDIKNVFNEVLPEIFLDECRSLEIRFPGLIPFSQEFKRFAYKSLQDLNIASSINTNAQGLKCTDITPESIEDKGCNY